MGDDRVVLRGPKRIGPIDLLRSIRNPRELLHRAAKEYGDPFVVDGEAGAKVVLTGNPKALESIFSTDQSAYEVPYKRQLAPFFGENSLILTTGPKHKRDRKLLAPPFNGARMRAYGETIAEATRTEAATWTLGGRLTMLERTQAITLEVILRAIFGVEESARRAVFREAMVALMKANASPAIAALEWTRKRFGGFGPWARYQTALARFDALIYEEIASRRERDHKGEDVLSLMMAARYDDGAPMSNSELRDQLHLLLFAGHDTTSTALAWAMYWLHRYPEVRERVVSDVQSLGEDPSPESLASLAYLEAVCHETLRIHPVAPSVARVLKTPMELCGATIAAGSTLNVSIILLHDREELYPEPRRFRPQRFLERKFSPFEFAPFGGGAKRCIGASFALYEMKIVLATLLSEHRLSLVSNEEPDAVSRGLTMGPKGGVAMVYEGPR